MTFISALLLLTLFTYSQDAPLLILDSQGHSSVIFELEVLGDSKTIVSGSWDKTIRFWDTETGDLLKTYRLWQGEGSIGQIVAIAPSPDGKYIAVSILANNDSEGSVRIIDVEKDRIVAKLIGHYGAILDLTYSADGKYVIGSTGVGNYSIYFWKVIPFDQEIVIPIKPVRSIMHAHKNEIYGISISPDGSKLVSVSHDSTALLWTLPFDLEKDSIDQSKKILLRKHDDIVRCCDISPDGKFIATGSSDRSLLLWDIEGNFVKQLQNSGKIATVRFSPNGKKLAAFNAGESELDIGASPYMGTIYSCPDGKIVSTFTKHKDAIMSACFIDDTWIATGSWNISDIYIWNTDNRTIKKHIQGKGKSFRGVGWSDGLKIAYGFENSDKFTETTLTNFFDFENFQTGNVDDESEFQQAQWEHNGRRLYSTASKVKGGEFVNDTLPEMYTYSFLNDESVLVSSAFYYDVLLYSKELKKKRLYLGHGTNVWAIATSPDQKYMVSAGIDQTIKLWSLVDSGRYSTFFELYKHPSWIEFCKNNNLLSEANSSNINDWNKIIDALQRSNYNSQAENIRLTKEKLLPVVQPLVSLFIGTDYEWICWTPNGYFNCSAEGDKYFGWHVNSGYDSFADFYPASQLFEKYFRPDIVSEVIRTGLPDSTIIHQLQVAQVTINQNLTLVPVVKIVSPSATAGLRGFKQLEKNEFTTELEDVVINAEIVEGYENLSEVRLYQNGKLIQSCTGDMLKPKLDFKVSLINGSNILKVIAHSKQRTESKPDIINIVRSGSEKSSNLFLLTIGINSYKNNTYNLNYALNDAEAIAKKIIDGSRDIFLKQYSFNLKDGEANKENILKVFNEIKSKAHKEDVFILYYAGHGVMSEQTDLSPDFYFVTHDITQITNNSQLQEKGISSAELLNFSVELKAQKQLFILDACQSGGAVEKIATRGFAEEKAITQLARSAGFYLMASSGTEQYASEIKQLGHGIFTYSIIEGLDGKAESASNDSKITVLELSSFLNDRVPDLTKEYKGQTQYPKIYIKGDDFPIIIFKKP